MTNLYILAPARSGANSVKLTLLASGNWQDGNKSADTSSQTNHKSGHVFYDPQDSLRILELAKEDQTAKFLYVSRTPVEAIASGLLAWQTGRFVTHPELPSWWGEKWSFQLLENWKNYIGRPLVEIVVAQFLDTTEAIANALKSLPSERWAGIHFEDFLVSPGDSLKRSLENLGLEIGSTFLARPVRSDAMVSDPRPNKWHRNASEIMQGVAPFQDRMKKLNEFRIQFGPLPNVDLPQRKQETERELKKPSSGTPYASSFTASLVEILKQSKSSLLISTYKTGKLITARVDESSLNTDFQSLKKPMGISILGTRLAVGTKDSVITFSNQPGLKRNIKSLQPPTAVFAPRAEFITGDISIHEMAFASSAEDKNLYFINTSFSCLCVLEPDYSWVPVWRPSWITAYGAQDRCHLNGLAMVDGTPRYVTALSQSNEPNGWREHKGTSGVLVDIKTDSVVASGLSMPHSPRWYKEKLWVLESGKGSLSTVNPATGEVTLVATLPGFTRGLSFIGKYAFVGLSKVRETVFKSLPITESQDERNCGVWVVDIETGKIVGFLRFDGNVQEIFDVAVLTGISWPEFIKRGAATERNYVLPDQVVANFETTVQKSTKKS